MKLDNPPEEHRKYERCPACRHKAVEQAASVLMEADWALWEFARLTFENTNDGGLAPDLDDYKLMDWCGAVQYRTGLRVTEEMAADFFQRWLDRRDDPLLPYVVQVADAPWELAAFMPPRPKRKESPEQPLKGQGPTPTEGD